MSTVTSLNLPTGLFHYIKYTMTFYNIIKLQASGIYFSAYVKSHTVKFTMINISATKMQITS